MPETKPDIFIYKVVADIGGAPCVTNDLLSLAICKPKIRKSAEPGSLIFGFGGKRYGERAFVLLSTDFRYFGAAGTTDYKAQFPRVRAMVENLKRGHRRLHSAALREELLALTEFFNFTKT